MTMHQSARLIFFCNRSVVYLRTCILTKGQCLGVRWISPDRLVIPSTVYINSACANSVTSLDMPRTSLNESLYSFEYLNLTHLPKCRLLVDTLQATRRRERKKEEDGKKKRVCRYFNAFAVSWMIKSRSLAQSELILYRSILSWHRKSSML